MSASCPTFGAANNASLFENACAIQKSLVTPDVTTALKTCCVGGGGVQTTSDGCFTYCNITNFYDTFYWSVCLLDNLPTSQSAILFEDDDASGCAEDLFSGSDNSSATTQPAGNIATTWLGEGQTLTLSSGGTVVETTTIPTGDFFSQYISGIFGGDSSTTTTGVSNTGGTKPTGTPTGKASTTNTGPASTSSKPSKASGGLSFSKAGAVVVVGLALFTAWL